MNSIETMSTTGSTAQRADRASRLAVVESLRELLRRHGKGGTLVESPSSVEGDGEPHFDGSDEPLRSLSQLERGALATISGAWSSGKTSLALSHVAGVAQKEELVAIVDGTGWLFPPALAQMGAPLQHVLLLHPPASRLVWTSEQILRSGLFTLVTTLSLQILERSALRRLQLAAERGASSGLLVQQLEDRAGGHKGLEAGGLIRLRLRTEALPPPKSIAPRIDAPERQCRVQLSKRDKAVKEELLSRQSQVALA